MNATSKDNLKAARAAKARKAAEQERAIAEDVGQILADPNVNSELKRKLGFCQRELEGTRPRANRPLLRERRDELIREARRRLW